MSNYAFDYLSDSVLWSDGARHDATPGEIHDALAGYREHILRAEITPAKGLGVAISACQRVTARLELIKQSALFTDEIILPDPMFVMTEYTRQSSLGPARTIPYAALTRAVSHMKELTPFVRLGVVRFAPLSYYLEPPEQVPLTRSDNAFAERVPDELRDWFHKRSRVRKVVIDGNARLVLGTPPDRKTKTIQVDFGQIGRLHGFDFRLGRTSEDGTLLLTHQAPDSQAAMDAWLRQSVNQAAGNFLDELLTDIRLANELACSFVTECQVAADLLELCRPQGHSTVGPQAFISLDLPMVTAASVDEIASLAEREPDAFQAFRFELRAQLAEISRIDDPRDKAAAIEIAERTLARDHVREVQRKVEESRRVRKWELPLATAQLAVGAIGVFSGNPQFAALAAGVAGHALGGLKALSGQFRHRLLPGYFLWRLGKGN